GNVKSIIRISETPNHTLTGQLVKIYPRKGATEDELCTACKGEKHNKPILGMHILNGLKKSASQWDDGRILDPSTGKTYKLTLHPIEQGKKLYVHGYIGIPLFGRTQIWERTDTQLVNPRFKN